MQIVGLISFSSVFIEVETLKVRGPQEAAFYQKRRKGVNKDLSTCRMFLGNAQLFSVGRARVSLCSFARQGNRNDSRGSA